MKAASTHRLISLSSALLSARLFAAFVTLLTQVFLARLVPTEFLGQYFFITSAVVVVAVFASCGYPNIANRLLSSFRIAPRQKTAAVFVKSVSVRLISWSFAIVCIGLIGLVWTGKAETHAYLLGLLAIPVAALSLFWGSVLNGERLFMWASLPDLLLRPLLFLATVLTLYSLDVPLTPIALVAVFLCLILSVAAVQYYAIKTRFPSLFAARVADKRQKKLWKTLALPLVAFSLFTNFFGDVAIAYSGLFLKASTLAPLAISVKLALLVGFFVQVAHQIVIPDLSDAARRSDFRTIQSRLNRVNTTALAFTVAALCVVLVYGDQLLSIFGPDYQTAHHLLVILVASQVVRAISGPAGQMLVVLGWQQLTMLISMATFAVFAISGAVLIPSYGVLGAAFSIALAYAGWNGANAIALAYVSTVRSYLAPFSKFANSPA